MQKQDQAFLKHFRLATIDDDKSWVTVAEGVWSDEARRRGAEGAVFLVRVTLSKSADVQQ